MRQDQEDQEQEEQEEQEYGCEVCEHNSAIRWWIAALGLAAWVMVGALSAIAWGVLR